MPSFPSLTFDAFFDNFILTCISPLKFLICNVAPAIVAAAVPAAMYISSKLAIPRDARLIKNLIASKLAYNAIEKNDAVNLTYRFQESFDKHPDREALVFEGKSYSYRDIQLGKKGLSLLFHMKWVAHGLPVDCVLN
jgi:non-ribosomal peptide synthetase component F